MSDGMLNAKFEWNGTADLLAKRNLESGGKVQQVIDKSIIDWCLQYAPWNTGTLAKSAYSASLIGQGRIIYPGPYARYLYYGEVFGPNIPVFDDDSGVPTRYFSPKGEKKHPTGEKLQFRTDVNLLAGSHWFERMKADHSNDILKEAKEAAGIE